MKAVIATKAGTKKTKRRNPIAAEFKRHWQLWVMALPAIALLFVFNYLPIGGTVLAFKKFDFSLGIFGSPWNDPIWKNFEIVMNNAAAWRAIRNTVTLNLLFISVGTVFAVTLSVMLNEVGSKMFKKITQSITFLPFFISWVVVGMFAVGILSYDNGVINKMIAGLGMDRIDFYMAPQYWPFILLVVSIWKGAGYSAVVYLATIAGISPEYYEAASIDGATRWQKVRHITLPLLKPTIIILTLLSLGNIMRADFGLFYFVTSNISTLYGATDVIDTFIYRALRVTGNIGISSAAGFFQSVVSFIIVVFFNKLANKFEEGYGLF